MFLRRLIAASVLLYFSIAEAALPKPWRCASQVLSYALAYSADLVRSGYVYSPEVHRYWWEFDEIARGLFHPESSIGAAEAIVEKLISRRFRRIGNERDTEAFVRGRLGNLIERLKQRARIASEEIVISLPGGGKGLALGAVKRKWLNRWFPLRATDRANLAKGAAILENYYELKFHGTAEPTGRSASSSPHESEIARFWREFHAIAHSGITDPERTGMVTGQLIQKVRSYPFIDADLVWCPPEDSTIFLSFVLDEVAADLRHAAEHAETPDARDVLLASLKLIKEFETRPGNGMDAALLVTLNSIRQIAYQHTKEAVALAQRYLPSSTKVSLSTSQAERLLEALERVSESVLVSLPALGLVLGGWRASGRDWNVTIADLITTLNGFDPAGNDEVRAFAGQLLAYLQTRRSEGSSAQERELAARLVGRVENSGD